MEVGLAPILVAMVIAVIPLLLGEGKMTEIDLMMAILGAVLTEGWPYHNVAMSGS